MPVRREYIVGATALVASSIAWTLFKRKPVAVPRPQPQIDPAIRSLSAAPVAPVAIVAAPPPPVSRKLLPHEEPAFGLDRERNEDSDITVDDYLNLPLEGSGLTHRNRTQWLDLDFPMETDGSGPDRFRFFRFKVLRTRDAAAATVAIGGLSFLMDGGIVYHPKTQSWNPHTGEKATFYPESAWSDSDQKELIVKFPEAVSVDGYKVRTSDQDAAFDPVEWRLEGSLNGVYWLPLDERKDVPAPVRRGAWMAFRTGA